MLTSKNTLKITNGKEIKNEQDRQRLLRVRYSIEENTNFRSERNFEVDRANRGRY